LLLLQEFYRKSPRLPKRNRCGNREPSRRGKGSAYAYKKGGCWQERVCFPQNKTLPEVKAVSGGKKKRKDIIDVTHSQEKRGYECKTQ